MRVLFVALAIFGALAVQEKPDFSGHWVLEEPATPPVTMARELVVSQWVEWSPLSPVRDQSYPSDFITIERRFAGEVRSVHQKIGINGGTVSGVGRSPNGEVSHTMFSTRWEDPRLVFETGSYVGPPSDPVSYAEHSEAWSFDDGGRLVIEVMDRSSEVSPTKGKLIYKRR